MLQYKPMFSEPIENSLVRQEKTLRELEEQRERMRTLVEDLFSSLGLSKEQLSDYISNPDNFSPLTWDMLQQQRQQQDELLENDLTQIRDQHRKKSPPSRVAPHWLFVR